jgi:hypothetical protein
MASTGTTNCTATIGQINQCVVDRTAAVKTAASSLSCDLAAEDGGTPGEIQNPPVPASCTQLQQSCAGFYAFIAAAG